MARATSKPAKGDSTMKAGVLPIPPQGRARRPAVANPAPTRLKTRACDAHALSGRSYPTVAGATSILSSTVPASNVCKASTPADTVK